MVAGAASRVALTRLAPPSAEVVVVGFTAVALVTGHASLALTLALQFAPQASRSYATNTTVEGQDSTGPGDKKC